MFLFAVCRYVKKYADGKKEIEAEVAELKKHCCVIRVLAHTQVHAGGGGRVCGWLAGGWVGGPTCRGMPACVRSRLLRWVAATWQPHAAPSSPHLICPRLSPPPRAAPAGPQGAHRPEEGAPDGDPGALHDVLHVWHVPVCVCSNARSRGPRSLRPTAAARGLQSSLPTGCCHPPAHLLLTHPLLHPGIQIR